MTVLFPKWSWHAERAAELAQQERSQAMSEEKKSDILVGGENVDTIGKNEAVEAMGKETKPDQPVGLATIPKGMNATALARRVGGELVKNELEYHCGNCGWSGTLHFEPDEMVAMDNNIRDYTGPCPKCSFMTLVPKDLYWGKDFPSMTTLAQQQKEADAKIQANALVDAVAEKVGTMMPGVVPASPTDPAPAPEKEDLPEEVDVSKLTPR